MATTRVGFEAICLVLMIAGFWPGQKVPAPPLAITDITGVIGSDRDARAVFAAVLSHAMRPESRSRQEFFLASQMREEWLPAVQGVEFVVLSEAEIPGHLAECGYYWIINRLERSDDVVSLWLGQKCGSKSLHYLLSLDGGAWRLGPPSGRAAGGGWVPGMGSGFVGRPPGCPCL